MLTGLGYKPNVATLSVPVGYEALKKGDEVVTQGGLVGALATLVNPVAALLGFIDPGLAEDADCCALIAGALAAAGDVGLRAEQAGLFHIPKRQRHPIPPQGPQAQALRQRDGDRCQPLLYLHTAPR